MFRPADVRSPSDSIPRPSPQYPVLCHESPPCDPPLLGQYQDVEDSSSKKKKRKKNLHGVYKRNMGRLAKVETVQLGDYVLVHRAGLEKVH